MKATGGEPGSAPAINGPQWYTSPSTNSVTTPTGTVLFSDDEMKVSASINSFQLKANAKIPAEIRPGTASGARILPEDKWNRFDPDVVRWKSKMGHEPQVPARSARAAGSCGTAAVCLAAQRATADDVADIETA